MAVSRVLVLLALCVLPALVSAKVVGKPFYVQGRAYCDTCRCGFETSATTYIAGATVRLECRYRNSLGLAYSVEGMTDETGTYNILVEDDHEDQICEAVLVDSPISDCKSADPGRSRANVVLTRFNGVVKTRRFANNMGFLKDQELPGCAQLLKQYLNYDQAE
ncbi:protein DOWNSTREAM OF FLC-like [Argentina anserina]|uniref:protein DOWNSTREAM OF FLC-like n=1 Tax=Argentina anserina TaxID=57926 RepID=UPI0021766311|nr:protein DOWNSTREAM OF FLC-like [Potentilla anserina]